MSDENILDFYPQGEEETADDYTVTLVDDEGNEVDMAVVDVMEHKGERYVILLPVDNINDNRMEFAVLKIEIDEQTGEETYVSGDEPEFDEVFIKFQEQMERELSEMDFETEFEDIDHFDEDN